MSDFGAGSKPVLSTSDVQQQQQQPLYDVPRQLSVVEEAHERPQPIVVSTVGARKTNILNRKPFEIWTFWSSDFEW